MKTFCFALDLKNDATLIAEYEKQHQKIWVEITESIKIAGILELEIYRVENRLFMMMKTQDDFSFEEKQQKDANNPKVQEWETLMWKYQQALPTSKRGEKWVLMKKIFDLSIQ